MKISQDTLRALMAYLSQDKGAVAGLLLGQDIGRGEEKERTEEDIFLESQKIRKNRKDVTERASMPSL